MNRFIFASSNKNKFLEISKVLTDIELITLKDIGYNNNIVESGLTLKENALIKCQVVYKKYNLPCISDDTGLEVIALHGRPGVLSARYAGQNASAMENMKKLIIEMKNLKDRRARFRTIICLKYGLKEFFFEGVVNGAISHHIMGTEGFGYDPVFIPNGYGKTFAELSLSQKNTISHRIQAIKKLKKYLKLNT